MTSKLALTRFLLLLFILGAGPLLFCPGLPAQQRGDEAQVEAALQSKLQSMLDILVGPQRTIVNIDVTLLDQIPADGIYRIKGLSQLPGVQIGSPGRTGGRGSIQALLRPVISSMHILVLVDNTLPPSDLEKIKTELPKWVGLDYGRGDTFKVKPIPWRKIVAPPSASQQNYLLYSILALVFLLILIGAIYFPLRKLKSPETAVIAPGLAPPPGGGAPPEGAIAPEPEAKTQRKEEMEELKEIFTGASSLDSSEVLQEIRSILEQGMPKTPTQVNSILEEIKDILSKSPQESDSILSEIRDTLADLLDEQRKLAAMGLGGKGAAAGPAAAAAPAAPAAAGPAKAGTGMGSEFGPEMVEVLGNIEDLMAQQLEKTPDESGMNEPFKYLKSLPPEDIELLVEDEEPKLAAAVLSQIDPTAAAEALEALEEDKQVEIVQAMTGLTEKEDLAEEIKAFLERKLKIVRLHKDYTPVLGYRCLADILSSSRYAVTKVLLEKMESKNPAMAAEVRKRMFLFEDILTLSDKDLEVVIHNLPREMIAYALADTSEEVRTKVFQNMTDKAREMIREDMESFKKVEMEKEGKELPFNEAIIQLEQNVVEELFRTVDRNTLKMALRGASEAVQEKFFSGLTERAVAMLKEDLEVMGQVSRARADEAQEEIMNVLRSLSSRTVEAQHEVIATIRKLEREGQITVDRFQEEMV